MENLQILNTKVDEIKKDNMSLKQLKQLCRKTTGDQLKIYDDDTMIICKYNGKIIGMCCIAMKSPESHFENENDEKSGEIPYLYNYMCDFKYKSKKAAMHMMFYIKDFIHITKNIKEINLNTSVDNTHAQQFFEKNNFVNCGEYQNSRGIYKMYTCVL